MTMGTASQLPIGWRQGKFIDLCEQDRHAATSGIGTNFPYLGLEDIESNSGEIALRPHAKEVASNTFLFGPEHVLYGKLRPYLNKVALPDFRGRCSTELIPLKPKGETQREFLAYALRQPDVVCAVTEKNTGARMPRADMRYLLSLDIAIPPVSEQRRIVDILKRADGIRRLRKQAIQTAREFIPALFVEMFGDPATNSKGWSVLSCGELIVDGPQNGLYKPSSDYGDGTPILRIDSFYDGAVSDWTSLRRLRISDQERAKYRLREGDIVINRVNSPEYLGKSALITGLLEETVFESNMMRFAVDTDRILPAYFIQYLQTSYVKSQILSGAKHAINQSSINQQDVKSLQVVVPPLAAQKKFVELTQNISAVGAQQQTSIVKSESVFAALLHRAFRGEL